MNYKIEYISFKNFKFFYGNGENEETNKLVLGRKNMLLYGENGSGKSSIYWALYTMLQSSIKKEDNDVIKYFDYDHPQNLRNRFASPTDDSGITLCFSDSSNRQQTREISSNNINTLNDSFSKKTLFSSDFMNYKYLSKIYDFSNSETLDLFQLFSRDLFQFIDLEEDYVDIDKTILNGKSFASDWWDNICNTPKRLPRNKNTVSVSSSEYKFYKDEVLPKFCTLLRKYLGTITERANEYLEKDFKSPFRLSFDLSKLSCEYNKNVSTRAKDNKLHTPELILEVSFNHSLLSQNDRKVKNPHTFLNEAKLTAIALAIRFAILDQKPKGLDSGKVLVLDDLLVSLDMSNRDVVLDIILKKTSDYQLLILTHDRYLYNFVKSRIEHRTLECYWVFKEMYNNQLHDDEIPRPIIINPKSYLNCAKKHFKEFDYPACANYLRKECERLLKYLLPYNLIVREGKDGNSVELELHTLISNFNMRSKEMGMNTTAFDKLMEYKNVVLNPLSHDNLKSPIYKQELLSCFEILENLNKLRKYTIIDVDNSKEDGNRKMTFRIDDTDRLELWSYEIEVKENFYAILRQEETYFNNPLVEFISRESSEGKEELGSIKKLNTGLKNIKYKLSINNDFEINIVDSFFIDDKAIKDRILEL